KQQERLNILRQNAHQLLSTHADELEWLQGLVRLASERNSGLRCAVPLIEPLNQSIPRPVLHEKIVLLAADGSQIEPDRHAQVEFAEVNVGVIRMLPRQGEPPHEMIRSWLLYGNQLYCSGGIISGDLLALMRDLYERRTLAELAATEQLPVVTLTDGTLELFREPKEQADFQQPFQDYLGALRELARLSVATAGYVDKPRADLVVRLLELVLLPTEQLAHAGRIRPLLGVTDADLFFPLLKPGERSAIFAIQSRSASSFPDALALHFFYLNVGREDKPWLARVEVPAWVVQNSALLNRVHAVLIEQCDCITGKRYPYALHRAHEIAVVTREEKLQVEAMLISEMRRLEVEVGSPSYKQSLKDLSGVRTRYQR
ncbi:MAG: DNA double-strand break repair nuclease NurA, partial [Anaerolineales bacterium]